LLKRLFYWVAYPLEASPRSLNSMTESHFFAWTRVTRSDDTVTQIIITLKTRSHSGGVLECEWRLVWWILSIRSVKMLTKLVVIMTLIVAYIRTCFHTVMHKYLLQYIHIYYICTRTRTRIYIHTQHFYEIWSFINVTRMKEQIYIYIYIDDTCMKYIYVIPVCVHISLCSSSFPVNNVWWTEKIYREKACLSSVTQNVNKLEENKQVDYTWVKYIMSREYNER
jgi:hypothetical protein